MSGAIPLLPQYCFIAWTGTLLPLRRLENMISSIVSVFEVQVCCTSRVLNEIRPFGNIGD
jgi:hypothetical protein